MRHIFFVSEPARAIRSSRRWPASILIIVIIGIVFMMLIRHIDGLGSPFDRESVTVTLIAIRADDGLEVESFSVPATEWDMMRSLPLGTFRMIGSAWPAVLKRSIRGMQFFAHAPGFPGTKPEPESEQHAWAKIAIAKALRAAGHSAWVERSGTSLSGEPWQADVLCQTKEQLIAFEVQLAQQTLDAYEARSARYADSGVNCVWLVRAPTHYGALAKAIYYRLHQEGMIPAARPALPHLAALPLDLGESKAALPEDMRVVVFPEGSHQRITVAEFAVGMAAGKLFFSEQEWQWRESGDRHD